MALEWLTQDWHANLRNPKSRIVLTLFRLAHQAREARGPAGRLAQLLIGPFYRVAIEWVLGIEIPWKTSIGSGLTLFHGQGLVINDASVIGRNVVLRNGVVIGHLDADGPCPVIGDNVEIGANAVILGAVTVGPGAKVGAGSVVLQDVPAGATAVGVPARIIHRR